MMKKINKSPLNRSSSVTVASSSVKAHNSSIVEDENVSKSRTPSISSTRLLTHFSQQRFLISIPQLSTDDCVETRHVLHSHHNSNDATHEMMSNSPSAATLLPTAASIASSSRTKIGQLGKQRQINLEPGKLAMPHQKSSESHDSSASAMSFTTSSGTSADEQMASPQSAREHRSTIDSSFAKPASKAFSTPTTPLQNNPDSAKSSWKRAFTVFQREKSSTKNSSKSSTKSQSQEGEDIDAIYRFLTCKKCLSGQPCDDPACPGRDPNQLPTITKNDLIAEQRRILMKRAEGRTDKRH